jgi:hypothetical protein
MAALVTLQSLRDDLLDAARQIELAAKMVEASRQMMDHAHKAASTCVPAVDLALRRPT